MFNKLINLLNKDKDSKKTDRDTVYSSTHSNFAEITSGNHPEPKIPDDGDPKKLFEYAYYWEFISNDTDLERAAYYYLKAATLGNADAMYRLGKYYESSKRASGKNRKHAEYWYKNAVKFGNKKALASYRVIQLRKRKGYRS